MFQCRFQKTILRAINGEYIVFHIAAFAMNLIDADLLRKLHLSAKYSRILFNRLVAAFQTTLGNEEYFINECPNKDFKNIHFFDIQVGCLKRFIWRSS